MTLKVGFAQVTIPGTTTTVDATDSNAGFSSDVKAAILLSEDNVSNDTASPASHNVVGIAANNGGTTQASIYSLGLDGQSPSAESRANKSNKIYGRSATQIADVSAWLTNGITINVTTTDGEAPLANVLLLGGDIECNVIQHTWSAETGNKAVAHGLGGAPEILIGINGMRSADTAVTDASQSIGFWAGATHRGISFFADDGQSTTVVIENTSATAWPAISGGSATTFTVGTVDATNVNIAAGGSVTTSLYTLAIRGTTAPLSAAVGTHDSPTSTSSTSITGLGFKPQALIAWGSRQTAIGNSTDDTASVLSLGFAIENSGGIAQGSSATDADDALAQPSDRNSQMSNTRVINTLQVNSGGTSNHAALTSFNSDGATFSWTIGAATAFKNGYLAMKGVSEIATITSSVNTIRETKAVLQGYGESH